MEKWSEHNAKICKAHTKTLDSNPGKCDPGSGSVTHENGTGLNAWFGSDKGAGQSNGAYTAGKGHEKWSFHNANIVSDDTAALSREDI